MPQDETFDRDSALAELVRRYLQSHGPATVKDMSWWSGLPLGDLRRGLEALGAAAISESVDGMTLWQTADPPPKTANRGKVHLLQAFDEFVVGYTESRYLGDPNADRMRSFFRQFRLPTGTVLTDSKIIGHWRRATKGKRLEVEVTLYKRLGGPDVAALEEAVTELGRFTSMEVRLHHGAA